MMYNHSHFNTASRVILIRCIGKQEIDQNYLDWN